VCVVGAGTAGLEALLAAHEALGAKAQLRLIAPEREFRYRPMSRGSLFRPAQERGVAIADLVAQAGAAWVADRAAAVYETERQVLTRDGDTVDFDFLLLALGARSRRALRQGYVWQRGGDPSFLDEIILGIVAGEIRSVAVVAPRGARWPLPAYELALVLAWTAAGTDARVTLITAEERPLAALGAGATDTVARELRAASVETITGVEVIDEPRRDTEPPELTRLVLVPEQPADLAGSLIGKPTDPSRVGLGAGSKAAFDRLIALPTVDGPFLAGVATDTAGFIEVDEGLKVCGSERVWAAGGCIAAALEHSALAARQADAAVVAIEAAMSGAPPARPPSAPELTGMLLTGQRDRWLYENPAGTQQPSTRCLWWPPGRAVGRMLAQRIAAWDPSVHQALPDHADGLLIRAPVALGCSGMASVSAGAEVSAEVRAARLRDIENRQLLAIERRERAADAELRALSAELQTLTAHQQEVIRELQQHGYLTHRNAPATSHRQRPVRGRRSS
jgi:sulfide:quinone oxidoreductase